MYFVKEAQQQTSNACKNLATDEIAHKVHVEDVEGARYLRLLLLLLLLLLGWCLVETKVW